ncbi:hypothetical protein [Desulfoluna spongiiphila]|uniref:Uncharacterized protein n=1 Tax=Desulfoluna spongiiphila TaxID=419481 RepID=A0A1G5CGT1_9BACT|nr:hypothetical protein [Desulfoluna spongiiphila]SCY01534.1 hypothetical protein SAMN05216233_10310 [Desulfoluna spongiiphila]
MKFKTKEAGVFFIDILGMSSLTQGLIDLSSISVKNGNYAIENNATFSGKNQHIAAWVLTRFRECLRDIQHRYDDIRVSQLSDCAFVWSENTEELLCAASDLMWKTTRGGVLCRGGLSYGEIIFPNNNKESFGEFILGEAITKAAKAEASGKGCRIFTDAESIGHFNGTTTQKNNASILPHNIFQPLTNPLDYSIIDEYKWYLYHDLKGFVSPTNETSNTELAFYMASLISTLIYSPYYAWNSLSEQGLTHLAASIDAISSSISIHSSRDEAIYTAEVVIVLLRDHVKQRNYERMFKRFSQYCPDAAPLGQRENTQQTFNKVIESLIKSHPEIYKN